MLMFEFKWFVMWTTQYLDGHCKMILSIIGFQRNLGQHHMLISHMKSIYVYISIYKSYFSSLPTEYWERQSPLKSSKILWSSILKGGKGLEVWREGSHTFENRVKWAKGKRNLALTCA